MDIHDNKLSIARMRGTGTDRDNRYYVVLFILVGVLLLLVNFVFAVAPASAQTMGVREACFARDEATLQLKEKFKEKVVGRGLTPNGEAMFEVFVSKAGTWTVLASDTNGQSCVVATGEAWQRIPLLIGDPA